MNQEVADKAKIRQLNDEFRCFRKGRGTITITSGLQAKSENFMAEVWRSVATFDQFNQDNDPHGEHDFGTIENASEKIFWKIDYYDLALKMHSPDPADPAVTHRVLTIMLAEEY